MKIESPEIVVTVVWRRSVEDSVSSIGALGTPAPDESRMRPVNSPAICADAPLPPESTSHKAIQSTLRGFMTRLSWKYECPFEKAGFSTHNWSDWSGRGRFDVETR